MSKDKSPLISQVLNNDKNIASLLRSVQRPWLDDHTRISLSSILGTYCFEDSVVLPSNAFPTVKQKLEEVPCPETSSASCILPVKYMHRRVALLG